MKLKSIAISNKSFNFSQIEADLDLFNEQCICESLSFR